MRKGGKMRFYIIFMYILSFLYYKFGNDSILIMLILYIFSVMPFIINRVKNDIFDIGLIFVVLYSLYITSIPIGMITGNMIELEVFTLRYDINLAYKVLYISGICPILTFILFYYKKDVGYNRSLDESNKDISIMELHRSKIFSYLLILSGILLYFLGMKKLGGLNFLKSSYIWNTTQNTEKGLLNGGFQLFSVGTIISFYIHLKMLKSSNLKLNIFKWKPIYIILPIVILNFFQGSRMPMLMFFFGITIIYNNVYKKISRRNVIKIAIATILFVGFWGYFRSAKTLSITENAKKLIFGGSMNYELQYNSYTAMAVSKIIDTYDDVEYLKGLSILDGITYLLPRVIFENKNSYLFTSRWTNYYNSITLISPLGGLNLAAQNLMNGGLIFSLIFMFLFSLLLRKIYSYSLKMKDTNLLYALFISQFMISLVRDPMFMAIKYLIQFCIIPYVIYRLLTRKIEN